jgi:hypothetical protein
MRWMRLACIGLLVVFLLSVSFPRWAEVTAASAPASLHARARPSAANAAAGPPYALYLPLAMTPPPTIVPGARQQSPFGVQANYFVTPSGTLGALAKLHSSWVRLGDRVSWRSLQPNPGDPIHWELMADFEAELRALKQAGITPVVGVNFFPRWATIKPTSCGAIRTDMLPAFAAFARALVARYSAPEFNVHIWELGNEPDVDPSLVPTDNHWGCWGDKNDPFYGGRQYGEMLKVAGPAIKAADPQAQIWIGGLLLDRSNSSGKTGRPELFLQGILEAGAAPYFDAVAYHIYAYYRQPVVDFDTVDAWVWKPWGGRLVGKARFLKQIMAQYGVDKPLVANEIGLLWCPSSSNCPAPSADFENAQASFIVRSLTRGIGAGVQGFFWYPLEFPGFRFSSLLNENGSPKPVYTAYQQLGEQLAGTTYTAPITYTAGIEAFAFNRAKEQVQVIWTTDVTTGTIAISSTQLLRAVTRDGQPIVPAISGANSMVPIGFAPIYVVLRRQ